MTPTRTPSRRLRLARRVMVCLLLGAIVNVAVAWGCAVSMDRGSDLSAAKKWSISTSSWRVPAPLDWPKPVLEEGWRTRGFQGRRIAGGGVSGPHIPSLYQTHFTMIFDSGWPLVSMRTWRFSDNDMHSWSAWKMGIELPDPRRSQLRATPIPLAPIPLSFTLNTLFYAAIISIPFFGFTTLKRRRRVRRGLCTRCAYDLTGLTTCPECGTPSPPGRGWGGQGEGS